MSIFCTNLKTFLPPLPVYKVFVKINVGHLYESSKCRTDQTYIVFLQFINTCLKVAISSFYGEEQNIQLSITLLHRVRLSELVDSIKHQALHLCFFNKQLLNKDWHQP